MANPSSVSTDLRAARPAGWSSTRSSRTGAPLDISDAEFIGYECELSEGNSITTTVSIPLYSLHSQPLVSLDFWPSLESRARPPRNAAFPSNCVARKPGGAALFDFARRLGHGLESHSGAGLRPVFRALPYSTSRGALYPVLATTEYFIGLPFASTIRSGSFVAGFTSCTVILRNFPSLARFDD